MNTDAWRAESARMRQALIEKVMGDFKEPTEKPSGQGNPATIRFQSEPGIWLTTTPRSGDKNRKGSLAIVLDLDGAAKAADSKIARALIEAGWNVRTVDLRATGTLAWPKDQVRAAPDHNTAQWGLWIGRPLLGQWALDVRRLLDAVQAVEGKLPERIAVIGHGPAGIVALTAAAADSRITHVAAVDSLASYVTDVPYKNQRLGLMVPGMLRDVGDVAHLAALCLPRRVVIAGAVLGDGTKLATSELQKTFAAARQVATLLKADALRLVESNHPDQVLTALR